MTWSIKTYRRLSALLWGAVCVMTGVSAAVYWQMEGRGILFMTILSGGAYLLYLISRQEGQKNIDNKEESLGAGSLVESAERVEDQTEKKNDHSVEEGKENEIIEDDLDEEEVREWLDDFLVKQQEK